ncbi:MAG: hypothetical protein PHQ93_06170 [Sulfurimonas sp.]|uniref:hypothetical protein n=1 Tax=Sulfurimonas sp. TaxID=2022749 RepID=UPI00260953D1|nr:hypothetical protein [Sulfurimonas sp.]MDD5400751.1 hypothetical protein [Sulfurimonas sp.]
MAEYVENGYSESGYVEGDEVSSSTPVDCNVDLTAVMSNIALLKSQNADILSKLETLLNGVATNKSLSLEINNKVVSLASNVANINIPDVDLSNIVTKDFFMAKIPFANDKHLDVYPNGTVVKVRYLPAIYTVYSSHFVPVPNEYHKFSLIYTVHKNINGQDYYSDYHSSDVININQEEWVYSPTPEIVG